ncbi:MAG: hypothetical protein IPH44_34440 [Myxococcales bacterium]|nr:hypothetical protein [Myxococcales bacterium]MBK7192577.1 hypothetical protein [Myxococcales bacterium]MBP6848947.1 hypothetical protein [Kofleriaceae bacterium]
MRALALALAVTVAAAPACTVRHRVTVSGADLRATIAERHRLGRSQLTGKHWRDDRVVGRQRVVVVDGQALWLDGGRLSLRELEQGCAAPPPAVEPQCALAQFADAEFEVRRYHTRTLQPPDQVVTTAVLSTLAGSVGCAGLCPEDSVVRSVSLVVAGGFAALLGGALVWAFVDCFLLSGLGSPGCRD